jgi:hypothetical protein
MTIDRHVQHGERVAVHEHEAPDPQYTSDAWEGEREPQTDPVATDKKHADREIDNPECGCCDDVSFKRVHRELRNMRHARYDE